VLDSVNTPELRPKESGEFAPIFLDRTGTMWISGPGGARITYRDGRFHDELTLPSGASGPVAEDDRGLIWMSGRRPHRFENGQLSPIPLPAAVPAADLWSVLSDSGGGLWIGTRANGLWHVSRSGDARQFGAGEIRPLIQSRDGKIWALGLGLQGTAHLEGDRWLRLRLPDDSVPVFGRLAVEDREGAIWFQTNAQGVVRYRSGVVDVYARAEGLADTHVRDIYVDPTGTVWVSTDAGLDRLRPARFSMVDPAHVVANGIGSITVPEAAGGLWTTADDAGSVLLLSGGLLDNGTRPLTARRFRVGGAESVRVLASSRGGGVWIKVFGGDLILLRPDGTRRAFGTRDGLPTARFQNARETRDGALWIELLGGLGRFHEGTYRPVTIDGVAVSSVNAFTEDDRGRLWLAWGDQPVLAVFDGDSLVASVAAPPGTHIDNCGMNGSTVRSNGRPPGVRSSTPPMTNNESRNASTSSRCRLARHSSLFRGSTSA
jgi:ligand-binding sensor domain-containing protein